VDEEFWDYLMFVFGWVSTVFIAIATLFLAWIVLGLILHLGQ
jgi:hypothetical protein